ncbi:GntP family permease [Calycomorphotria hydatis]|uniref:Gnt-II system L-idonate transporter n=1 Tax=Calycomorphotria hydatis TaxID=2528027 RepID=A0A517T7G9_9PLAN|nr:SLC13 family permease [Calycomorphotria hydatis]QDT64322.1 Gnt-II system L-idonate transporter [Calycomorphotria hydatis]
MLSPLLILAVGVAVVIGMILFLRINAFLALLTAAFVVSFMAPGEISEKVTRVAESFGGACAAIGIVIALAAVIGQAMLDSGAADRIVRAFLAMLGEKRSPFALLGSGYLLSVPVFFDTVFYLLVPLARSFYRKTGNHYLKCLAAIAAGGAITHTLVPPTPGPLAMAEYLGVDLGMMIGIGALVAMPSAFAGLLFAGFIDKHLEVTPPDDDINEIETSSEEDDPQEENLPPLVLSALPVILPVILIGCHTFADSLKKTEEDPGVWTQITEWTALFGNPNFALFISAIIALLLYRVWRGATREKIAQLVEHALMSGGVIILITAAGASFGGMLKVAEIGPEIKSMFEGSGLNVDGLLLIMLGFGIASLLKIAQGSSTAAMIVGSGMMAAMIEGQSLSFHPVYLATAVGSGSLFGSWMNDSGFWIFTKMGGLTEAQSLKSWTPLLAILGATGLVTTLILATLLPMAPAS